MGDAVNMETTQHVENIKRKAVVDDQLIHEHNKGPFKVAIVAVGSAVLGGALSFASFIKSATRTTLSALDTFAARKGYATPLNLEAQHKILSDPKLVEEFSEHLAYNTRLPKMDVVPAILGGAMVGGFAMQYMSHKKQTELAAQSKLLGDNIAASEKQWQDKVDQQAELTKEIGTGLG